MIDRLLRGLVVPSQDRLRKALDVENVGDGIPVGRGSHLVVLIIFVIKQQVLLVEGIEHPTLMSVRGTGVAGTRDDFGRGFVGDVVDCEGVLVVTVAAGVRDEMRVG